MSSKENLRPLKILVISMGLLLIGGMVLVLGVVAKKMSEGAPDCKGGAVDLKGRGMVIESRMEDQVLRVTLEKNPGHSEIVTIDSCSGKILGTLTLDSDTGSQQE